MDNKVYILGGSQTDFERNWTKEGKSFTALLKELTLDALNSVGITFDMIDKLKKENRIGIFIGNFCAECYVGQGHLGALMTMIDPVFYGIPCARYEAACASGSVAADAAFTKLKANEYDLCIIIGWEMMKTVDSKVCGDILGKAAFYEKEAQGLSYPFPHLFSRLIDEMLLKYISDERRVMDALASISYKNYTNAKRNPNAQTRHWFMDNNQTRLRGTPTNSYVGGKLAISDCSQVTDGGAAVIACSNEFYKKYRTKEDIPVCLKGWGHRIAPFLFNDKINDAQHSSFILPWTKMAVDDAYQRASLTIKDVDFFETHDCFTSSEYMAISAFGITSPGSEYTAIENGQVDFHGDKPINPSGGLIGCGHPVGATGVRMLLDVYKQIAQKAGEYQLSNAHNGMTLNLGGTATTNYTFILGRPEK